jgi:hypothetical protein
MNCLRPTLLASRNEVRQADVHYDVFFRRACFWNRWEIWQEALNHVQAPGRIQDRRDMRGLTLDKAYRLSQTLSLWFRRRLNDLLSFWKVSLTNSEPLDDLEFLEFHISSCMGAVKLLKLEGCEQTSAIASNLYENAFPSRSACRLILGKDVGVDERCQKILGARMTLASCWSAFVSIISRYI